MRATSTTCVKCGKLVPPGFRLYCSTECRNGPRAKPPCPKCGKPVPSNRSKYCSRECQRRWVRPEASCLRCGAALGPRRRSYCSAECHHLGLEKPEPTRPAAPWSTLDFPGAVVLWRRAKSWKPGSQQRWQHLYRFEVRLLDGRVVRDEVVYEHAYPTEEELRRYLGMLIQNLIGEPIDVVVDRILNQARESLEQTRVILDRLNEHA